MCWYYIKIKKKVKNTSKKTITATLKGRSDSVKVFETYINDLKVSKNKLTEFDEGLFYALVDKIIVKKDKITVVWKDGTVICG